MQKLKVGIIGLNFGLSCHLPAFKKNKKCKVIALCSRNINKAKISAKKNNIPFFFNKWKYMLDSLDFDIVSIAVPPIEQEKIINYCLKKSIPVFAEKPLATDIKIVEKIFNLQKKFKIPCSVDFEFPEVDEFVAAKKILESKKFGSLKSINVSLKYQSETNFLNKDSWKNNINYGGGVLNNVIPHIFFYIEWFFEPIISLSAFLFSEKKYKYSGYTNALVLMKFASGAEGVINASNNIIGLNEHIITFSNENGFITLESKGNDWVTDFKLYTINKKLVKKNILIKKKRNNLNKLDARIYPVSKIVNRLIKSIFLKKDAFPNFKSGFRTQYLVENAIKSHKCKNKWIKFKSNNF